MNTPDVANPLRRYGWLLLILLTAVFLRLYQLPAVPPGLTHDEADHGLTALAILNDGARDIYFTVGYGREPLYDYLTAALMAGIGPTYLAGRLTAVYASLLLIATLIAWASRAFSWRLALLAGAGLAVSFWPLTSARQSLRSILLPAIFVLALLVFWRGLECVAGRDPRAQTGGTRSWCRSYRLLPFLAAGLLLGLTFYTYIPARGLWLVYPALLVYWLFRRRELLRLMVWRVALMLAIMLLTAVPLLRYLHLNPGAETRITQLAGPLDLALRGDWSPLLTNAGAGLGLLFLQGDTAWRYNIAGKPLLGPVWALLLLLGLAVALQAAWRGDGLTGPLSGSASFLALAWLAAGLVPVLITGPDLGMTQAIAMQPVLYLFPAMALDGALSSLPRRAVSQPFLAAALLLFFSGTAVLTFRDYFQVWANAPEVRVQYETTLVNTLDYVDQLVPAETAVSTITPGRYHSPAVAQLLSLRSPYALRWFDGRGALLLPRVADARVTFSGFAPLAPALQPYLAAANPAVTLPLRPSDLDRPVQVYEVAQADMREAWQARLSPRRAQFGDSLELLGYELQTPQLVPGGEVRLVTRWQARRPLPGALLFTHLLGPDGVPLAQADRLDAPGEAWIAGDSFVQLHQFTLPADLAPGDYALVTGVYTLPGGARLPVDGTSASTVPLATVEIQP